MTDLHGGFPTDGSEPVTNPGFAPFLMSPEFECSVKDVEHQHTDDQPKDEWIRSNVATTRNLGDLFVVHSLPDHEEWSEAYIGPSYLIKIPADVHIVGLMITTDRDEEARVLTTDDINPGKSWRYEIPIAVDGGERTVVHRSDPDGA